jgi:hypothetical protein
MRSGVGEVRYRYGVDSIFDLGVRSQPRSEIAGHLAQPAFHGWRATSGRARRVTPRILANEKAKF